MNVHSFIIRQRKRKTNKPRNSIHSRAAPSESLTFTPIPHFSLCTFVKPLMGLSSASPYHILYILSFPYHQFTIRTHFSLAENNNKTFFRLRFLFSKRLSWLWRLEKGSIVFVCSTKHLRKLFVV